MKFWFSIFLLWGLRVFCSSLNFQINLNETVKGKAMTSVLNCPHFSNDHLQPHNIHIIIASSANYMVETKLHTKTVRYYAKLRGYQFRIVDPTKVLIKFGSKFRRYFHSLGAPGAVLNLKGLTYLCKFVGICLPVQLC